MQAGAPQIEMPAKKRGEHHRKTVRRFGEHNARRPSYVWFASPKLDLREQNERNGGEHERGDELEAGRSLCRAEQTRTEEVGGEDDREIDERHERAEERSEEQHLDGGRQSNALLREVR